MKKSNSKIKTSWKKFWDTILYKQISIDLSREQDGTNVRIITKKRNIAPFVGICVLILLVISFCFIPMNNLSIRFDQLGVILSQMFTPLARGTKTWDGYWAYMWGTAVPKIFLTVEMTFIATIAGAILSIPLFMLAARNITKSPFIYQPVRIIVNIIRTIPTFVLAVASVCFFGLSELAGIVAMTIFTTGIIFKLMYEYIETIDMQPFEAILSSGGRIIQSSRLGLYPEVKPVFISYLVYTFEINIRA
jgi:ABC-type phosphate/phosphonate transport system permease subunit